MRAFVLGGGGNLGAMQVGALDVLMQQDIVPQFLLGCSVGSLNAAMLASNYTADGIQKLQSLWMSVNPRDIYPGSKLRFIWRLLTKQEGLCHNRGLYKFLVNSGIDPECTFGDLSGPRLYVTAMDLDTGYLHTFGNDRSDLVIDALMASTAQPPFFPPWEVRGRRYIDGAAVTPLPLRVALEKGANEIYSLRVEHRTKQAERKYVRPARDMASVVRRSVNMMIQQQAEYDLLLAKQCKELRLHELKLSSSLTSHTDFAHSDSLIRQGYNLANDFFSQSTVRNPLVPPEANSPVPRLKSPRLTSPQLTSPGIPIRLPQITPEYTAAEYAMAE